MSEYMHPQKKGSMVPEEESLFNEDVIDAIAHEDGLSKNEVRQRYGLEASVEPEPVSGAYITLEDRALAVNGIIEGINRRNKASGASQQAEGYDNNFRRRYQFPDEVASVMRSNAKQYVDRRESQLDTLNATDAMTEAGFDSSHTLSYKNRVRDEIKELEGTGAKMAYERRKFNEKVQRAAKNARQ